MIAERKSIALATSAVTVDHLRSDLLFVTGSASIELTSDPDLWAAILFRTGSEGYRLLLKASNLRSGSDLVDHGLADVLIPVGHDPADWVRGWLEARSAVALASASTLVGHRGGDRLERFEFARLFAAGVPQEGLTAFLEKREARWSGT